MLEPGVRAAELKLRPQATLTMEIISDGLPRTG
jgi:hypothetical protein